MLNEITLARPYAKAVFELAIEQKKIKAWQENLYFLATLVENEDIKIFLQQTERVDEIENKLISISGDFINSTSVVNFIKLLTTNHRLLLLPTILSLYLEFVREYEHKNLITVVSAMKLTREQQKKIIIAMEKRLNSKVELQLEVDSSIISGVIIKTKDFVIDSSGKGQLQRLSDQLL